MNIFVRNCVEEEKQKNEASFLFGKKEKKNEYNRSSTIEDLPLLLHRYMKHSKHRKEHLTCNTILHTLNRCRKQTKLRKEHLICGTSLRNLHRYRKHTKHRKDLQHQPTHYPQVQ
jgi:hypothetical protein